MGGSLLPLEFGIGVQSRPMQRMVMSRSSKLDDASNRERCGVGGVLSVVAYGGGVNSTAMLVEMSRRNVAVDLILFADTGGERPETYAAVAQVSAWCVAHGLPAIVTVREPGPTLEEDCLTRKALPSIAYGFKTCSQRWKARPQDRYLKAWLPAGANYRKAIGYDVGEERRCRASDDARCENWFPLIEWSLWRDDCEAVCLAERLPTTKSACWFCPSSRKGEVLRLAKEHPELMARAAAMEANAELVTVQGLGRHWSWANLVKTDAAQLKLFSDAGTPGIDCGCYDG
jgi:hypothetical protein